MPCRLTFCGREERLDLLDELLDGLRRPLQLLLVRVQRVAEVRRVLQAVRELQRQQTHLVSCGGVEGGMSILLQECNEWECSNRHATELLKVCNYSVSTGPQTFCATL